MDLKAANLAKVKELLPTKQWAAKQWIEECFDNGVLFEIREVFRTQERQNALYAQGRTKPGPVVTWTKTSLHTLRIAADCYPLNGNFKQMDEIGLKYGIYRPADLVKLGDKVHYQFDHVADEVVTTVVSKDARLKGLMRRLAVTTLQSTRDGIERLMERLKRRA